MGITALEHGDTQALRQVLSRLEIERDMFDALSVASIAQTIDSVLDIFRLSAPVSRYLSYLKATLRNMRIDATIRQVVTAQVGVISQILGE
jgi:hypothetical protein